MSIFHTIAWEGGWFRLLMYYVFIANYKYCMLIMFSENVLPKIIK